MKDKLGDIGGLVPSIDLVTIALNGMPECYQMFITGLVGREKPPKFEELTGIMLQEEDRCKNLKPQNPDLALVPKKKLFKGKQGGEKKGGRSSQKRPFLKSNKGMAYGIKCFYYGRIGLISRNCCKKKNDEYRHTHRRQI